MWDSRWWFIQLIELSASILLSLSVFITHYIRLLDTLMKALTELKRSNMELENFSSVAAHDLAEPLRMVSSYCTLISRSASGKLDEKEKEYLAFAVDGAKRMSVLIKQLLEYSRIGRSEKSPEEANCENIVNQALKNLEVAIMEQNAEVKRDVLPTVLGNPVLLCQLFQNLISNGIKYRKPDASPVICISAKKKGSEWIFSVRDNGIGIKPEYLDQIFIMFKRLHGRAEYSGTGIGLATCKKIAEIHGGRIWAESQPGEGSTFFFSIPVGKPSSINVTDSRNSLATDSRSRILNGFVFKRTTKEF